MLHFRSLLALPFALVFISSASMEGATLSEKKQKKLEDYDLQIDIEPKLFIEKNYENQIPLWIKRKLFFIDCVRSIVLPAQARHARESLIEH